MSEILPTLHVHIRPFCLLPLRHTQSETRWPGVYDDPIRVRQEVLGDPGKRQPNHAADLLHCCCYSAGGNFPATGRRRGAVGCSGGGFSCVSCILMQFYAFGVESAAFRRRLGLGAVTMPWLCIRLHFHVLCRN